MPGLSHMNVCFEDIVPEGHALVCVCMIDKAKIVAGVPLWVDTELLGIQNVADCLGHLTWKHDALSCCWSSHDVSPAFHLKRGVRQGL